MKKSTNLGTSSILSTTGLFLAAFLLSSIGSAAEGSFEVMCRNKAKEIAADTYKGCMTENRQTQLDQIRKEYKEELSNLKNLYDKKLKKLSGGTQKKDEDTQTSGLNLNPPVKEKDTTSTIEMKKMKSNASKARAPVKKVGSGTQVIDLSKPIDSQINGSDESTESAWNEKKESSNNNEVELVEITNQQ